MFNVTIEQEELMEALKAVRGTVGKGKDVTQNDKYVYMETLPDPAGKPMLRIITSNTCEISDILVEVVKGDIGVCSLIEYELFYNMVATIDSTLEVDLADNGNNKLMVNYTGRKKPIVFNGIPSSTFLMPPALINQSDTTLPMAILKEGLDLGATIIHDDTKYPVFNCISAKIENGTVEFSAIDSLSKRMLLYRASAPNTKDGKFFIECNKIRRMISGFDVTKDVTIQISSNNIVFEQDSLSLTARLLNGTFPDITQFIPAQYKCEVIIDKAEILTSLKRAMLMTETIQGTKSVVFNFDGGFITINLNSTVGMLSECILGQLNGPAVQMAFLVEPLSNAISSIDDDKIKMCFYDKSCTILKPVTSKGFEHSCLVQAVRATV